MIDHARRQLQIVEKEYLHLIEENVAQDTFYTGVKRRKYPVGARWFWALQAVYAPKGAAIVNDSKEAAE
ncbi:hypothetical protein [Rhizobium johnstonii]|jgi:hypothetical protein|uniref:hypothetical protein n=1 Tax=Rhizobium johnstonii TaxID=3019933 RepID=UPI003F9434D0